MCFVFSTICPGENAASVYSEQIITVLRVNTIYEVLQPYLPELLKANLYSVLFIDKILHSKSGADKDWPG